MDLRLLLGTLASFGYNRFLGHLPSRVVRRLYLRTWLGSMGEGTAVQSGCRFLNARKVHLGQRNVINFGCLFDGRRYHIRTGSNVSIGPCATILTLGHDVRSLQFNLKGADVIIGNRVWIGYGALILPGVTIGEGAVVGAVTVVTKDVAPYAIVAGNPARVIGERPRNLEYQLHFDPWLG